jgi:hypothetical protein
MSGARAKVAFMQNEQDIGDLCAIDLPPLPEPSATSNKPLPYLYKPVGAPAIDESSPMDCSPD